jgi:hypothetical protein
MPARARSLGAFYYGPVWTAHREVANGTMEDSSNVLLLKPARPDSGFALKSARPAYGTRQTAKRMVTATTYSIGTQRDNDFLDFFEQSLKPELMNAGAEILAYFVTENSENNFPVHPVRENENVLVCFSGFSDETACNNHLHALDRSSQWLGQISDMLTNKLSKPPEVRKLSPTDRSLLR